MTDAQQAKKHCSINTEEKFDLESPLLGRFLQGTHVAANTTTDKRLSLRT